MSLNPNLALFIFAVFALFSHADRGKASQPPVLDGIEDLDGESLSPKQWQKLIEVRLSGGSWSGSGGDGVACFDSDGVASRALGMKGRLKPEMVPLIRELYVLDYYEFKDRIRFIDIPRPGVHGLQDSEITRRRGRRGMKRFQRRFIRRTVGGLSPLLRMQLFSQRREIPISSWKRVPELPAVNDSGRVRVNIPANCRLVQMALRLTPGKEEAAKGSRSIVFIDRQLFRLLRKLNSPEVARLNRLMLFMHEKLYLVASKLGHYDSSRVRRLVALLYSRRIDRLVNSELNSFGFFFSLMDRLNFYDFYQLAANSEVGDRRLVRELATAYLQLLEKLRAFLGQEGYRPREVLRDPGIVHTDFVRASLSELSSAEAFLLSSLVVEEGPRHVEQLLFRRREDLRLEHCSSLSLMTGGLIDKARSFCSDSSL